MEAAADAPEVPADARNLTLDDGSTVLILPMTWQMMKAAANADPDAVDESLGELMQAIEDAVLAAKFKNGRSLQLQPSTVFRKIFREWGKAEDEAALPKANEQPSATPS